MDTYNNTLLHGMRQNNSLKQKQADDMSACFCPYDHSRVIRHGRSEIIGLGEIQ